MKIDPESGLIQFTPKLTLHPGITRQEILSIDAGWEDWNIVDDIPRAFRAIISLPKKGMSAKTILIVYVGVEHQPIAFWDVAPWDIAEGSQARPEGKCTKRMRRWFDEMCGVRLPLKREWGHVDASFDPWNQTAGIVCNYRERFSSEAEWSQYKKIMDISRISHIQSQ